jgi:serine/threonine protein kinase, bacterial
MSTTTETTGNASDTLARVGRRASPRLLAAVVASGVGLIAVGGWLIYYLFVRAPVTDLPGVQQLGRTIPPRHLFDFAGVASPVGIAVSPDGQRVFVSEGGGERLVKAFDRDGQNLGRLSAPGSTPGTRAPAHLAIAPDGRLFAVDRGRAAVDVYSPSLEWQGTWEPRALQQLEGWLPNGIAFGEDGRIYVTDVGHPAHRVLVLSPDGTLLDVLGAGSGIPDGLNYPIQAVADSQGRVYISDGNAGRLLAIGTGGPIVFGLGGDEAVGLPRGLAIGDGRLLVADASTQRIVAYSTGDQPEFLHAFGDEDTPEGLAYPNAVALDRTGRVYVADRANQRVQVWSY